MAISGRKKQFNFRFEESEVAKWQKVADLENRSLTNLIETVMQSVLQKFDEKKRENEELKSRLAELENGSPA